MLHKKHLVLSCLLATGLLPASSLAEEVFNLTVSYHGSYDSALSNKEKVEANLQNFADAVYEMTNGAHRIGRVEIYTDGANKDNNDITWIAECWPNAHVGGRGKAGWRIEHCDTFPNGGSPMSFLERQRSGGYTIGHEWGHFTYALYDEYQGSDECNAASPGSPCKADTPIPNSIMHSQWNAVGENETLGDLSWLNFSTPLNNKAAAGEITTAQARKYKASAWETVTGKATQGTESLKIYADLAAVAPADGQTPSVEIDKPENVEKARSSLVFEWKRGDQNSSAGRAKRDGELSTADNVDKVPMVKLIVIDNSINVHSRQLESVKAAIKQFIQQSELNDVIGILTFNNETKELKAPTLMATEADKAALIKLVDSVSTSTQAPALGVALQKAGESLKAANVLAEYDADIYLFANGYSATGITPANAINSLQEAGVRIFGFALNESTETVLRKLSESTGGASWFTPNLTTLQDSLVEVTELASATVDVTVANKQETLTANTQYAFYSDAGLGELEINLDYVGKAEAASFKLVDPKGKEYPVSATEECFSDEDPDTQQNFTFCSVAVPTPAVGEWQLQVTVTDKIDLGYQVKAYPADNNAVYFATLNAEPSFTTKDKAVLITASVAGESFPMAKLTVSSTVTAPDGSVMILALNDDGKNGDEQVNDGFYSASLNPSQVGVYQVEVKLDNKAGTAQFTNLGTNYAPSTTGTVPTSGLLNKVTEKFERVAQTQVLVKPNLASYQQVMNWAEAVYPNFFANVDVQELEVKPYKVRYYPLTNSYLGYNPDDGNVYVYSPTSLFGENAGIIPVGSLNNFLEPAKQAGF